MNDMSKLFYFLGCLLWFPVALAQQTESLHQTQKVATSNDTIYLAQQKLNPEFVEITKVTGEVVPKEHYIFDAQKGQVVFRNFQSDSVIIKYVQLPDFLSKTYTIYDLNRVVNNATPQLFASEPEKPKPFIPFDGLNTSGNISRGMTIGNNQNAVLNSTLDLQITGKLSDNVSIRASIQDANIPMQEGGYSQKLDEFDQIFIEIFSKKWNIRAGDLFLENRQSRYLNFNKKVQGLSTQFTFGTDEAKTDVFAAAALVRGQYAKSTFVGEEGNQGPYKLKGANGELYVLVVSGSENVYVNGRLLKRGENNDYIIDYNAGEIIFTSLFPISSEMRISIEYQYSDRNYTRFTTYAGATHTREKWKLGGFLYAESDLKNQPLQQSLSEEQVAILQEAGNDPTKMFAPSAYADVYSENKILYQKLSDGTNEYYEFSTDETAVLYNVKFSLVGNNLGNYILANNAAVGKIYQYVAPINGEKQGNYDPIVRLIAPTKIQIATVLGSYNPSEKTNIDFELGLSNNDQNLYSSIDDGQNKGLAGHLNAQQRLFSGKWNVDAFAKIQFIEENFKTIERLFNIEFNRDWNISTISGNQNLRTGGFHFALAEKGKATYQIEQLEFSESFKGTKHTFQGIFNLKNWSIAGNNSLLESNGTIASSKFVRTQNQAKYHWKNNWMGTNLRTENNQETIKETGLLSNLSQRFSEMGGFIGRGDSTKVFVEVGYLHRVNDSLVNGMLQKVNKSNAYYLKSKLIQNDKTNLGLYLNYRELNFEDPNRKTEPSINSRILYSDQFFDQLVSINTNYENTSGSLAQQEFTYLEVEPGQGVYTWIDYNNNGIQELEEFEIAAFQDQAKYVRIYLPNQVYLKTHQNKFSQSVVLNPAKWINEKGAKKILSYFYNQTTFLSERKIIRDGGNFNFNPFSSNEEDLLGLNSSFSNSLFYNRGKQQHSVTYTFLNNKIKNQLSIGSQSSSNKSHQLQYTHLFVKTWLLTMNAKTVASTLTSENYSSKNYTIEGYQLAPKLAYLFSKNTSLDVFAEYQKKENTIGNLEALTQSRLGLSFTHNSEKKLSMNGEFSMYNNQFDGDVLSAVSYQILEGLQPGKNFTWRLMVQKNLTQFLDINLNYQARKSDNYKAIHTGNIQLRAFF